LKMQAHIVFYLICNPSLHNREDWLFHLRQRVTEAASFGGIRRVLVNLVAPRALHSRCTVDLKLKLLFQILK
jgi:hypothetical protein